MSMPILQLDISKAGDAVIIQFIGEARLDVEAAAIQLDRVIVHHPKIVILDCTRLSFLSSIGMSLFVNLRRTTVKNGGIVKIAGLQPFVEGALKHACLLPLFEVYPTLTAALADLPATPSSAPPDTAPAAS